MNHLINWIEIPATNISRAETFYNNILGGVAFHRMEMAGMKYSLFPSEDRFNAGALVQGEYYVPSTEGITIYLDGGKDLGIILEKVKKEGGTVLMEKTYMGEEAGHVGIFLDSEGNKIGLQHE